MTDKKEINDNNLEGVVGGFSDSAATQEAVSDMQKKMKEFMEEQERQNKKNEGVL